MASLYASSLSILAVFVLSGYLLVEAASRLQVAGVQGGPLLVKRAAAAHADHKHSDKHSSMVHSHLSRKVFDRACAASKDTIDEVIACLTGNEIVNKTIKPETAGKCFQDSFGTEFDPKDAMKHKELICNNREKFENMTACIYRTTAESMDEKEFEKMTEAMVDVGLCIINALDG